MTSKVGLQILNLDATPEFVLINGINAGEFAHSYLQARYTRSISKKARPAQNQEKKSKAKGKQKNKKKSLANAS